MSKQYFYIYLKKVNEKYDNQVIYKFGCTTSLYHRYYTYQTSEVNECQFIKLIKFKSITDNIKKECLDIENKYKEKLESIYVDDNPGGKEFYYSEIKTVIDRITKKYNDFIIYNPKILSSYELIKKEILKDLKKIINKTNNHKIKISQFIKNKIPIINILDLLNNNLNENINFNKFFNEDIFNLINKNNLSIDEFINNNLDKINNDDDLKKIFHKYIDISNNEDLTLKKFKEIYNNVLSINKINKEEFKEYDNNKDNKYNNLSGFQCETLDKMIEYYKLYNPNDDKFKNHNKGYLNICCRMGKTRIALCYIRFMKFNKIIVFVPAVSLINQWYNNIKNLLPNYKPVIFNTNEKNIINYNQNKTIYICHYINSLYFINEFNYDFVIFDEFHHLTKINFDVDENKEQLRPKYINCLKVNYSYNLSLSATLKIITNLTNKKPQNVLSNDDINYYGYEIDKRTYNDGIKYKRLCDLNVYIYERRCEYNNKNKKEQKKLKIENNIQTVLTIMFNENKFNKNIFFVNSINTINNICIPYIQKQIKENKYDLKYFAYHSKLINDDFNDFGINTNDSENNILKRNEIIKNMLDDFKNCNKGILFAVYGLSEGFDMPYLDSVAIGEKMSTNIRITQTILRPTTYDINNINKKASIVLPCTFDYNDTQETIKYNKEYEKVLIVLYLLKIKNINVMQKVIINDGQKRKNNHIDPDEPGTHIIFSNEFLKQSFFKYFKYYTYKEAINKLSKCNFISKQNYYDNYIDISYKLPEDPEKFYDKDNFDWYEFLNIKRPSINDIKKIIKIKFINDYQLFPYLKKNYKKILDILKTHNFIILDDNINYFNYLNKN